MKSSFQKILGVFLVVTTLAACNKDDSNNNGGGGDLRPLNVTPANLAGAWEVESRTLNGQPQTASSKLQFEISEYAIYSTESVNNRIVLTLDTQYTIQNNRIVTEESNKNVYPDFDVLTVTASTMQLRVLLPQTTSNQTLNLNLRRIDPSLLVGGSRGGPNNPDGPGPGPGRPPGRPDGGGWDEQSIQVEMITPSLQYSYKNSFKGRGQQQQSPLRCSYSRESNVFELDLMAYRRGSQSRDERNLEAQLSLVGKRVDFDFSRQSETVNFSILDSRREQRPGFVATYNPQGGRKVYFSLTRESRCNVTLTRYGRTVKFEGMCRELDANGDRIEGRSRVSLKGSCRL